MKSLIDLITDEVKAIISNSTQSASRSSNAGINTNVSSRQNQTTLRTQRMWTPGKPFTDEFYFSGYPITPTDKFHNTD